MKLSESLINGILAGDHGFSHVFPCLFFKASCICSVQGGGPNKANKQPKW